MAPAVRKLPRFAAALTDALRVVPYGVEDTIVPEHRRRPEIAIVFADFGAGLPRDLPVASVGGVSRGDERTE
jgi:hypothetical protein